MQARFTLRRLLGFFLAAFEPVPVPAAAPGELSASSAALVSRFAADEELAGVATEAGEAEEAGCCCLDAEDEDAEE